MSASRTPIEIDRLFARAVRARNAGDLDGALKLLVEALELAPRKARLWIEVADCQREMGHGEEALRALRRAERTRPDSATVQLRKGIVQLERDRPDLALRALDRALEIEPSAVAHNLCFSAYTRMGEPEQARGHLKSALGLDPGNAEAHCNLGVLLSDEEKLGEAEKHLRRALKADKRDAVAHAELGRVLLRRDHGSEAIPLLRRAVRLNPNAYWARLHLAEALTAGRRFAMAEKAFKQALAVRPAAAQGYARYAGFLAVRPGRADEAERQLQTALMLDPDDRDAQFAMAERLLEKACTHLESAADAGHPRAAKRLKQISRT
ncbi:MAG: tetratricopeptide repeat protein [bacterium]|nr:tetratricopeptide repeat protein [bacterium]